MILRRQWQSQTFLSRGICDFLDWSSNDERHLADLLLWRQVLQVRSSRLSRSLSLFFALINASIYLAAVGLPYALVDDLRPPLDLHNLQVLIIVHLLVQVEIVEVNYLAVRSALELLLILLLLRGGD